LSLSTASVKKKSESHETREEHERYSVECIYTYLWLLTDTRRFSLCARSGAKCTITRIAAM